MTDEELDELEDEVRALFARFNQLADDFTQLRHDVNELEEKVERRT